MEKQITQTETSGMKREWLLWLILLVPFLYIPFVWDKLPDSIPTHWNIHGEPNQYRPKNLGTFFIPGLNIIVYLFMFLLPKIDPRKRNYQYFGNTYRNIRLTIAVFVMLTFFVAIQTAMGNKLLDTKTIFLLIFGLIAVFGNFMRTIRSNFFVGIRTPWTLDNPEVWRRTHEVGGKLWFYASLAAIVILFFLSEEYIMWFQITYLVVIIVYPILYSYLLFRKIGNVKAGE